MDASKWDISVCGLNCARCGLLASNDCGGCRGSLEQHWSPDCEFLSCARDRGHAYCFQCGDFPCDSLETFAADGHGHHRLTVENMKRMRAVGLARWIAEQEGPMFCPGWHS